MGANLLDALSMEESWEEYLNYKVSNGHIDPADLKKLREYINRKAYKNIVMAMEKGEDFALPEKKAINKIQKNKKRIVYIYPEEEGYVLKLLTYLLLRKYDGVFSPNLYSFRKSLSVKNAIDYFTSKGKTDKRYGYKVDISNYFNSVDVSILLPGLKKILAKDLEIYEFIKRVLTNPYVIENGEICIDKQKGIMAGSPLAAFLANVYLCDIDHHFYQSNILYARYSDDILLFAKTEQELKEAVDYLHEEVNKRHLIINADKENYFKPGEEWVFLGIRYQQGCIDISAISLLKIKQKMRRKARALLRWKNKKGVSNERAAKAFIRAFNQKLFEGRDSSDITWARWYFPIINTSESLKVVDAYMQDCIRYILTEKRTKGRFSVKYETMKDMGYRSLVHEYYEKKNPE